MAGSWPPVAPDTTALLWDVAGLLPASPQTPLTADERSACWNDLAGNAAAAYRSLWKLANDPGAIDLFRGKLEKVTAPGPGLAQVPRLLADLDSDRFEIRTKAKELLAELGPAIEADLRKTLAAKPSVEVRYVAPRIFWKGCNLGN